MRCPKCKSEDKVKNGMAQGLQRYRCKACKYNYTRSTPPGKAPEVKKMALLMYLEGVGFRAIGRLLNISNVTVLYWVRKAAQSLREAQALERSHEPVKYIQIDEMWHYVEKKQNNFGCGLLMIQNSESPSGFSAVVVTPRQEASSITASNS